MSLFCVPIMCFHFCTKPVILHIWSEVFFSFLSFICVCKEWIKQDTEYFDFISGTWMFLHICFSICFLFLNDRAIVSEWILNMSNSGVFMMWVLVYIPFLHLAHPLLLDHSVLFLLLPSIMHSFLLPMVTSLFLKLRKQPEARKTVWEHNKDHCGPWTTYWLCYCS